MENLLPKLAALLTLPLLALLAQSALCASDDLGGGFLHHGVATPVSNHRGTVATVDGDGRNIVLLWLYDHRGCYSLLWIDAQTGESQEYPIPFSLGGDCPYASILSSTNKFYTHFNSHFVEFDPARREFTFVERTAPQMAMGMTEDDSGVIWAVTYPQSGVVSFDPKTREFKDWGYVYTQNWSQYQRYVAADDAGWVYFGIGNTKAQIIAFDPASGTATPIIPEDERPQGDGYVYRDMDGKVYGYVTGGEKDGWLQLYEGRATRIGIHEKRNPKPIITGSQGLFYRNFPDGKMLKACDLISRKLVIEDPAAGETKELSFDYTSEGAHIMALAAAPDGTICGGTAFPMRFFAYNPATDSWVNREAYGQWNTVGALGDRFYAGGYGGGVLMEWEPARPWADTRPGNPESNPLFLAQSAPTINRPHDVLPFPDGKLVVLAGTPGYGYTGGGLLIWDREAKTPTIVEHTQIIPEHSTFAMVALPEGKILAGTTTAPGTGGEKKATVAKLYVMDMGTRKVVWRKAVFPGVQEYTDLMVAPNGLVYGFADRRRFFVFDPVERKVVHAQDAQPTFGYTSYSQGPRVFVKAPDGRIYVLFSRGIAQVDPESFAITMLAESPVPVGPGGDYLNGRIYFASGSHVYSWAVPKGQ